MCCCVIAQGDVKASVDLPAGERKAHFLQGLFVLTSIGFVTGVRSQAGAWWTTRRMRTGIASRSP